MREIQIALEEAQASLNVAFEAPDRDDPRAMHYAVERLVVAVRGLVVLVQNLQLTSP